MTRTPPDSMAIPPARNPGPWRQVRYALGFRLPPENHDWVRHDLTDAGWRGRLLLRHCAVLTPICLALACLPAQWWARILVFVIPLLGGAFVMVVSAAELRAFRLRRHGINVWERAGPRVPEDGVIGYERGPRDATVIKRRRGQDRYRGRRRRARRFTPGPRRNR